MKTVLDLKTLLDQWAPFDTACSFDNCGLLVGDDSMPCTKVGVALDVTPSVIAQAKQAGCDVIVSHHPVIFSPLRTLPTHSMPYQLAQANIACIACHTNLDKADGGTNDCIANLIGLQDIKKPVQAEDLARLGMLKSPVELTRFVGKIKGSFSAQTVRFLDAGIAVHKVLVVAGSGGECLELAVALGADTLVTGDLKHDRYILAQQHPLNLVELCHQDAEVTVLPSMLAHLTRAGFSATILAPTIIQAK